MKEAYATGSRHTIKLYHTPAGWMTLHSDPAVKQAFGTDVLPTAYTANAPQERVLQSIRDLNPGICVSVLRQVSTS